MSRRRLLIICSGLLVVVAVVILAALVPRSRPPAVSRQQCEQLKEGMTRQEVEAVIGGPPGDYTTREYMPLPLGIRYCQHEQWVGDEGMIFVYFDQAGRVRDAVHVDIWLYEEPRRGRTFLDGLRASLGL
jgi:hypothetical protein